MYFVFLCLDKTVYFVTSVIDDSHKPLYVGITLETCTLHNTAMISVSSGIFSATNFTFLYHFNSTCIYDMFAVTSNGLLEFCGCNFSLHYQSYSIPSYLFYINGNVTFNSSSISNIYFEIDGYIFYFRHHDYEMYLNINNSTFIDIIGSNSPLINGNITLSIISSIFTNITGILFIYFSYYIILKYLINYLYSYIHSSYFLCVLFFS
jgi:hypothetical protein